MGALASAALTCLAVLAVVVLVRLNGLRSFSKMSSFDFALTVATGSILANMTTSADAPWPELAALATLFLLRFVISLARQRWDGFDRLTDNRPLMLMHEGDFLDRNLRLARVTRADVLAKLREANATDLSRVRAVVMEATGDISVLHADRLDPALLKSVSWGRETPRDGAVRG